MLPKMDSEVECAIKYHCSCMSIERAKLKKWRIQLKAEPVRNNKA